MIINWFDNNYLKFVPETEQEQRQIEYFFTRKIKNYRFRTKWGNGEVHFYKKGNLLPIGLWNELVQMCKINKFPTKIDQTFIENIKIKTDLEEIRHFCHSILRESKNLVPYDEQIESIFLAIKNRFSILNLSTSLGKSLLIYLLILYIFYRKHGKKVLIVCIDPDLVMQLYDNFLEYAGNKVHLKMGMVYGKSNKKNLEDKRIIIGNFQTLVNMPKDFFKEFDVVISDEAHRTNSKSMIEIFKSCINSQIRCGLTGSFKDDKTADYYTILSNLGPVVNLVKKKDIMDKGMATIADIKIYVLNYATTEQRSKLLSMKLKAKDDESLYTKIYQLEQEMIRESEVRARYLANFIATKSGNILVYFLDVMGGYGKKIMEMCQSVNNSRNYYYVDGSVSSDLRKVYMDRMEENDNIVIFATYGTMSTGKNIRKLHTIINIELLKAFETVSQTFGRGMRKHESKDKFEWIDIVDDFSFHDPDFGRYKGYSLKHMKERCDIYEKDEGLEYKVYNVDLTKEN